MTRRARCSGLAAAVVLVVAVIVASAGRAGAGAFERIERYDVDLTVESSGALLVRETIVYDFGSTPRHGIFRDVPVRVDYPRVENHDRVYPLDVVSVRASEGTPAQYSVDEEGNDERIKIGDPDRTITGSHTYEITYRVRGALNGFGDHDELVWDAIGTEWSVPITHAAVAVHAPADITAVNCRQGSYGSNTPCATATASGRDATFTPAGNPIWDLGPFEGMTVSVAFPAGVVPTPAPILEERFTIGSAFRVTTATGTIAGVMLALLVVLVIGLVWWFGRDRRYRGSAVDAAYGDTPNATEERVPLGGEHETPVEFVPPDDLRPGQVGTLVDFAANPLDVTATIVDLAVRGYLHIQEIPKEGWFGKPDWQLTRLPREGPPLLAYEDELLEGLFRDGDEVLVSELRERFAERLHDVQRSLYDDALTRRWFRGDPEKVRSRWALMGAGILALGVGLTYVLARWTHFGLVGIAVIVGGIVTLVLASRMPARTAEGTAMVRRVRGFRRVIETAETHMARWAEEENVFTRFLPYAVVFGLTEKWAKAFEQLGIEPDTSSWYAGQHAFTGVAFADAIDGFAVTTGGTLASTPASSGSSGFGGGGFSGGGGGGGGGGSW
jgi:hypothetical protein